MKALIHVLLWLPMVLGVVACSSSELPVAISAGFVTPQGEPTPTETVTHTPSSTDTQTPTDLPPSTATLAPNTPTFTPLPSVTATPLACWRFGGRLETRQIESEWIEDALEYLVYLPPCYDEQPQRYYPTLYLFHGQTYRNNHWIDLGAIDIVDRLLVTGELSPFIIVFPYDREHYVPPPQNQFGEAVFFDLLPAIEREFRALPEREYRAIGGISRGGNWAIHIGLPHPGFFSAIGAHSAPIFSTDTNEDISGWLADIPFEELPRLFIDSGESDLWLEYILIFEQLLTDEGIPHEWYLYPGYHENEYWQAHLDQYLRWYAKDW